MNSSNQQPLHEIDSEQVGPSLDSSQRLKQMQDKYEKLSQQLLQGDTTNS